MSLQSTLAKIAKLMLQIKSCLKRGQTCLPLYRCSKKFDPIKKVTIRHNPVPFILTKSSISALLRIIQILTIVLNLLQDSKFITKRNLYYQLVSYYQYYALIDDDLLMICDTLKIDRPALNIIPSSKLQMFWYVFGGEVKVMLAYRKFNQQVEGGNGGKFEEKQTQNEEQKTKFVQKQHIELIPYQIFKIPNCPKLQINIIHAKQPLLRTLKRINFLIMQKESLFEILTESLTFKHPSTEQHWFLINSKGYPDMTALQFVNQMIKLSQNNDIQFYYIGDNDMYGIDIMLNYGIGNQTFSGLWPCLKWLCKFEELLQFKELPARIAFKKIQYRKLTVDDKRKAKQILSREYFDLEKLASIQNFEKQSDFQVHKEFMDKMFQWKNVLEGLVQKNYQCEVESYFKNVRYPFDVIQLMVDQKLYI